jgi:hypothetical protein
MFPFELFIFATPVSRQARKRKKRSDWREDIREEALNARPEGELPVAEPIRVRMVTTTAGTRSILTIS